ncbi:hypothetical protein J7481_22725 [Labrenzia sp. R4_2]|uniref:hypothetical protein n=1 Tax=Labrenzia sp. R4_2 TaxID=2821107 RepID=UPI001ADA17EF|nr:hypothetical protein [Labrenzia sp. R4_2]MBO9422343.1 hypothetical protein [Labrenzia sp. R4_2]
MGFGYSVSKYALRHFLHKMAITQQSTLEIHEIDFAKSFNRLLLDLGYALEKQMVLVEKLQLLQDPTHAARVVHKRIDPQRCTWVEISKGVDAVQYETLGTLRALHRTCNNEVIPLSVLDGFLATWRGAVIEAAISSRGAPRVRSAAQADVYRMSRCELHQLKAQTYDIKHQETTLRHLVKRLSAA